MDITITAQKPVSEFLQVAQELVTEIREWANVLWVRVIGCRPRFVSKKAVKIMHDVKINATDVSYEYVVRQGKDTFLVNINQFYKKSVCLLHPLSGKRGKNVERADLIDAVESFYLKEKEEHMKQKQQELAEASSAHNQYQQNIEQRDVEIGDWDWLM